MSSAFTGFVLLNEAKFDKEKFLKDLKEDWKVTLDLGGEDETCKCATHYSSLKNKAVANHYS